MIRLLLHIYNNSDTYKIGTMNLIALIYSFFETTKVIEKIAQIVLLIVTIIFTIYKIVEIHNRKKRDRNDDDLL